MNNLAFLVPNNFKAIDIVQIVIIFFALYELVKSLKNTRAWLLVKGIIALVLFYLFCALTDMVVLEFILQSLMSVISIAVIIMLQPELQKIMEKIGITNFKTLISSLKKDNQRSQFFSNQTIDEISTACEEMSKVKTGALIVLERNIPLETDSGIKIGADISSQLLINVFEKNTPLHDGAVIIQNNKLSAATCYLPLSKNNRIKKSLGTRHRAGIGVSETSDAIVVIVSEETGHISVCSKGKIREDLSKSELQNYLYEESKKTEIKNITNRKHETSLMFKVGILLLSCIICFSIINIEDPVDTKTFYNVPVEIINQNALTENNKTYEIVQGKTVSVEVEGHRSDLSKISQDDIKAVADFEEMSIVQAIPIQVSVNSNAEVNCEIISDEIMKLELEDLVKAEIPVTVTTKGSTSNYLAEVKSDPAIVTATGTRSAISKIGKIEAVVELHDYSDEVSSSLNIYDKNGEKMDDVSLDVKEVNVQTTVYNVKEVTLVIKAGDYEEEKNIYVSADDSLLEKTEKIVIEAENLEQGTSLLNLNLYLPEGYYLPSIQEEMITIGGENE